MKVPNMAFVTLELNSAETLLCFSNADKTMIKFLIFTSKNSHHNNVQHNNYNSNDSR